MNAGRALPFAARFGFSRSTSVRASWGRDFVFGFFPLLRSFPRTRESSSFFLYAPGFPLEPVLGPGMAWTRGRGRAEAVFFLADVFSVFTLSLTLRFDCHTASPAFAMPSMVRRLTTDR